MKRIVRFDSMGGASGDMVLGALAGAGADAGTVRAAVAALPVEACSVAFEAAHDGGLQGTRARVSVPAESHVHRGLSDILDVLARAKLAPAVRELAGRVFTRLATAEARVHGTSVEAIHFHEVGGLDAMVDVVGGCAALLSLDPARVEVGPLPVGRGSIAAAHGALPLPVPAVVELLGSHPVLQTDIGMELVTPTGAALLMTWQEAFRAPVGPARVCASGNGFGARALPGRANALRALVLEADDAAQAPAWCTVLECNLDDMQPELVGGLGGRLLEAGALDVFTTPVFMKKQRPGVLLTVLCEPARRDALVARLFAESTTFGVREYETRRTVLARRRERVATAYGDVRIKLGFYEGRCVTRSPEYDDCAARATEHGVAARVVYEAALAAAAGLDVARPETPNA